MELKVWVDGVQRVICGVTEATTCQEVVIALAQAIGRTGRYTLIEKWRDTERHLVPHESPVASLNTWGQYAGDVQFILHRTGPSLNEYPSTEGLNSRGPERGLHRQSLPLMAKLRAPGDRSFCRREPRRKSLTYTGAPRSLRDILSGGRLGDTSARQREVLVKSPHNSPSLSPRVSAQRMEDLTQLVRLQRETLSFLDSRMEAYEAELRMMTEKRVGLEDDELYVKMMEEVSRLEKQVRRNKVDIEEEEFWASELEIERESERQLQEHLQELSSRVRGCEADLEQRLMSLHGVEAGIEAQKQHKEIRDSQQASEGEVKARLQRVKSELKAQAQHTTQLENSSRALERSLAESCKRRQASQYELEQLTKELRQVNLQQFIQQTGTKVTVLPVEPSDEDSSNTTDDKDFAALTGSLKRPGASHPVAGSIHGLHSPVSSGLNPEGIYV
ncbi:ras association domain-containing protein 8-like [Carassius auratus]|uniref:Ras association domain-containing protein 8-like n=1 Tax=Carassius auratus TaxID=7957 RepID=A0A6P6MFF4_CARAU|nr:ras association domain-containing protein 8-like [Carassius auratus]XP_026095097.1 ras association domain-containing protein 8-like [Carassius auratus]